MARARVPARLALCSSGLRLLRAGDAARARPARWRRRRQTVRRSREAPADAGVRRRIYRAGVKAYLDDMLTRLAPASDSPTTPYRVTLLDSPIVNAFALPSGDIFITRGLLGLAGDGAEVAAVMAHEIAHITAKHAAQRADSNGRALFKPSLDRCSTRPDRATNTRRARSLRSPDSRANRNSRPTKSASAPRQGGFDPYAASRFLDKLGRWSALARGGTAPNDKPDMMATHPSTPERIAAAIAQAKQIGAEGIGDTRATLSHRDRRPRLRRQSRAGFGARRRCSSIRTGFAFRAPTASRWKTRARR